MRKPTRYTLLAFALGIGTALTAQQGLREMAYYATTTPNYISKVKNHSTGNPVYTDSLLQDNGTQLLYNGKTVSGGTIKSTTGTRYVCVDTNGNFVASATACSGT